MVKVNPQESYMLLYAIQRQLGHPVTQLHMLTIVFWLTKGQNGTAIKEKNKTKVQSLNQDCLFLFGELFAKLFLFFLFCLSLVLHLSYNALS